MARISSSKRDPLDSSLRSTSFVYLPTRSLSQSAALMSANRLLSSCRPSCVRESGKDVSGLAVVIAFSVSSMKIARTYEKPKCPVGRPCFLVGRSLLLVRACAHTRTYRVWAQTLYERPSVQKRIQIFYGDKPPNYGPFDFGSEHLRHILDNDERSPWLMVLTRRLRT